MPTQNQFVEGLDPTGLPIVGASELLQLIREAHPEAYIGLVFVGTTAPDIANNPQYARYLWLDTTNSLNPRIKIWTGTVWQPYSFEYNEISGLAIQPGSIPLTKLNLSTSTPNFLFAVNSTANGIVFVDPLTIFGVNSFPISSIVQGANNTFLKTISGLGPRWRPLTPADVLAGFNYNKIQPVYLDNTGATAGQVLTIDPVSLQPLFQTLVIPPVVTQPIIPTQVVFNSPGTYTWNASTIPNTSPRARIKVWGAGGGGQDYGGGGGGYSEGCFALNASDVLTIFVGAGGIGNTTGPALDATKGGNSQVQVNGTIIIYANPGYDGKVGVGEGKGGEITVVNPIAPISLQGGKGSRYLFDGSNDHAGSGGNCPQGGQGGAGMRYLNDKDGCFPGGGGASLSTPYTPLNGGNGAGGLVIIEY
jgi:hypothetical protein